MNIEISEFPRFFIASATRLHKAFSCLRLNWFFELPLSSGAAYIFNGKSTVPTNSSNIKEKASNVLVIYSFIDLSTYLSFLLLVTFNVSEANSGS